MPSPYGFSRLFPHVSFLVCIVLWASFVAPRQAAADPAERVLMLNGDLVTPEHYPELKAFLDSVRRDLQRSLHLRLS